MATGRYERFAGLLLGLRQKAGIAHQLDLAKMMGSTQQTVSRWEAGESRPRQNQIPLLAKALDADVEELLSAAGYIAKTTTSTLDQPFPIDALASESFERFCFYVLQKYYPEATTHRLGTSGHAQDGADIEVAFKDGRIFTFQCKRVQEFGPQKVHTAVAVHTRKSTKSFLLLSRIATPQARRAISQHPQWDIWDKEDISLRIRELPAEEQRRVVDTFFRGQRRALLGQTESGPWQTSDEFFAPFITSKGAFTHSWKLIGRQEEIGLVLQHLENAEAQVVFLVGPGGAGKSRVLKHAVEKYEFDHPDITVRFLSATEEVSTKALEDLGDRYKIIVVDDAHDRPDLSVLLQHAALPATQTRLLLVLRPYGLDYISAQASNFAITEDRTAKVVLDQWALPQATALATQVLEAFAAPAAYAKDIARLTLDCPLATVIAAQIFAKTGMHFALLQNEDIFRSTLLGKFQDVITGSIGRKSDGPAIEKILRIVALVQPFHPDDESICSVVEKIEGLPAHQFRRLVRSLKDAGVFFKRGTQYRISPDMLADYIVQDTCVGLDNKATGYAEQVFAEASGTQIENLLVNLGKLDWRLANGDPSGSQLLDKIWTKLHVSDEHSSPHLSAVTAVAYYQPARALDFAESLMRQGRSFPSLVTLIRNAAYSYRYLPRACECLWELGRADNRRLNQHPSHGIRVLAELCAVEPGKPIEFSEVVVKFALSLINEEGSWTQQYSPFDILKGILHTEGHTSESDGRSITLTKFNVRHGAVLELRRKVIDVALQLLHHRQTRIAVLAARFLHDALRYPMSPPDDREDWHREFVQTLERIENVVQTKGLHSVVLVEIISSISWHADYADGETGAAARKILDCVPASLEFRTAYALIDGYGHLRVSKDYEEHEKEWNSFIESVAKDLLTTYASGDALRNFVDHQLSEIEALYTGRDTAPFILYRTLVERSPSLAWATAEDAISNPQSKTKQFSGFALSKLLRDNHTEGVDMAHQFLKANDAELDAAIGIAYSQMQSWIPEAEDVQLLRQVLGSENEWTLHRGVDAIRNIARCNERLALELLKGMKFATSSVADFALMMLHGSQRLPFGLLNNNDIESILGKLLALSHLDGYWIETFLSQVSKYHSLRGFEFLLQRAEHAIDANDWQYRVCNYGPYQNVSLRFRESHDFPVLFRQLSQWMESRESDHPMFHYWVGKLFDVIFRPFDEELIGLLEQWIDSATPTGIRLISNILREAHSDFVFEHHQFVLRFLEKSRQIGKDFLKRAISALITSATAGLYGGTPGEPFPRDINMRDRSTKALEGIGPLSSAYELYQSIKDIAEGNIKRSEEEAAAFD